MDQISENINEFESLLKNRSSKKPLALYTSSEDGNKLRLSSKNSKISAKEVLANVSRQVKALQNADTVSYKRVGNTIDKYKKREFMTVDMLPVDREVHQKQPTKFETQCVSDTQLINVIENAEIVDKHGGVTQEFDKTFCQNSDNDSDDKINDSSLKPGTKTDAANVTASEIINNDRNTNLKKNDDLHDEESRLFDNSKVITCEMDTLTCYQSDVITDFNDYVNNSKETQGFNKCVEIFDVSDEDADRPLSPVLNTNRKSTPSPLVVDLYAFEKFENLANPIIEEHADLTIAKSMINSQIIGKEILIPAHNYDNIGRDSPVLSKIECITTNFNKDDEESICTCSNNCVDKNEKCTNEQGTDDIILTSKNKKTQSKVIKAEIKDEILFSSDEEYEYLHKSIQELPLTCALETSFYDMSQVLDKTMYVGFQTASNKSIQINTDSFTKAKSMLSDINNEETGCTLSDLVEIFDSGKAVSENLENVKLTSNKMHCDTNIQTSSITEHSHKNLSQPSMKVNGFEEKIDDTLQNVSLTALEQGREDNDEIVMSQIINFKSTLRSTNNSIISDGRVNDTLENVGLTVLEQNKEKDDDIMMSQVLTFKSTSRTPHVAASVSHGSMLGKAMAKRKLEGFKTASNKKIKLSDNALARCKKVFQDIDLDDSEYLSSKSNIIETEEITNEDANSHDFDNSNDALNARSNHPTKENYICDNVPNKMISEDGYFETDVEEQTRNEDIHLQINDQILIQEFEENEMPLKETNNNAYVGFKTASNKNIAISEVAMAATKHVFQDIITIAATNDSTVKTTDDCVDDIGKYENVLKNAAPDLINMAAKKTKSSVEALPNIKNNIVDIGIRRKQAEDHETYDIQKPPTNEFVGFKTASHKEIMISAQAREKAEDFYRDLDEEPTQNVNKDGAMHSSTMKKNINNVADEFNCGIDTQDFLAAELTHIEALFKDNIVENKKPASPTFKGFQTASRKTIVISEKALEKSKKFFEDITNKECDNCHSTRENEQDKTQPSNFQDNVLSEQQNIEQVDNSETSLEHNNVIIHNTEITETIQNEFLTGNHAMSEFQNINSEANTKIVNTQAPMFAGFKTASSTSISVSNAAMEKTKRLFSEFVDKDDDLFDHDYESPSDLKPPNTFLGFQTASKKKINISAKALAKSKQLLTDLELKDKNNDIDDYDKKITEHNDSNLKDESVSFKKRPTTNEACKPSTSKFIGFQTASNKTVTISKAALARSKQLFQDFDIYDKECDVVNEIITTREEKNCIISENAQVFQGFQTASNKKVQISEQALEKSKRLFEDFKLSQLNKDSNAAVDSDGIYGNEAIANDIMNAMKDTHNENKFKGFQTASNKIVKVSDQALENTKDIFKDFHVEKDNSDNLVFKGFQTASNKQVKISEKALAKSKKLFEDINLSQLNTDPRTTVQTETINDIKDPIVSIPDSKFTGFQTASNKKVIVSDQALAKTKDLFKDIDMEKENAILTNEKTPIFKGFQTASNKNVAISEMALAKSKKLFEDFNLCQIEQGPTKKADLDNFKCTAADDVINKIRHIEKENTILANEETTIFKGFQTASNKNVAISEKALAKSRKLFEDINLSQIEQGPTKKADLDNFKCTAADDVINKIRHIEKENTILANEETTIFKGFQTASNKNVAISEKALAKGRKLFEDINLSQIEQEPTKKANLDDVMNKIREPVVVQEYKHFGGFQTASNRKVKISEQALAKTKDIFKDTRVENENDSLLRNGEVKTLDLKANVDITYSKNEKFTPIASKSDVNKDIIDTQVLNDFESTLNTEDFCKTTPVSKRSGSPILSCPRAKKRKFETPYRTGNKKVEPRNVFVPPKLAKTYKFNEDYKKHKKHTLNDIVKLEKQQTKVDVDPYLSEFDFDSLLNFVFNDKRNDYTDGKMTIEGIKKIFLDSVNRKIVPEGWLENHIKLIMWKLISYELKFPNVMKNACTVRNVLEQLKYRYDKELYHVQRPILRKILEKDEVPSKTMVLCVAAIYVDNVSVTSVPPSSQNVDLLVTDGWYCIKACLDRMLIRLVINRSIVVGTKVVVCGAELINCEQGVAPWEDTSSVRLKLHGNSTRRARWLAPLGPRTDLIPSGLRAARADGGRAAVLRLAITRVYPPLTVERMDDGSTVTLSERLENIRQMKYESERQVIMEKLYEEVEKEMSDLDSQDSEGSNEKGCIDSGSQIAKCMKKSKDPDEYRSHLTKSQSRMLEDNNSRQREKLVERVRERFQEKLDKYGLKTDRNVVQLLKVRVADFTEKAGSVEVTKGYLSIWRPSATVLELVTEDAWIEILNVIPTGMRNSEIQLSTGRQTVFNPYKQKNEKYKLYANTLQRKCYEIKEITQNPSMTTDYNEIDTVGMIFCIEPSTKEFHEQSFQNVYLADADKNIICVNFWGGLKKFGYENVLDTGQIITCVNLQKRAGNTRKSIPQYRVTELSYFTKTPKSKKAMEITNEMTDKLSKIKDKFCEDCIVLKDNYSIFKTRNNENVTPYRFEYNIPKNSPRNCDVNLNLTGLDFESSFDSQEISTQALLRKKKVNEKIEKIRLNYGEPPPLSSIHIINKSKNASATYKSPLISNLERSKSPLKMASPVNRTFVKSVNPVKLNFSRDLNESVDHFADDFDASLPLSLDSDTVIK